MHRRRIVLAVTGLALLAAVAGWIYWPSRQHGLAMPAGQSLEVAQLEELAPLPAFALERAGTTFTAADLRGRWSFVYFGYTNCPDACPATLGLLSHVQEALRAQGLEPPRIVFISLDPRRDTPELLRRYTAVFGPDTIGATGSDSALQSLVTFFGIAFERKDQTDKNNYTIDHTTNFFLLTPDGRWLATFAPAEDSEAVAQDTLKLLRMPLP
ncbi:MAG TPA: SCO family protein [Burkholderiaceae bacterium]|nr:SCO family protein [Burkholderiaceae bacterium]